MTAVTEEGARSPWFIFVPPPSPPLVSTMLRLVSLLLAGGFLVQQCASSPFFDLRAEDAMAIVRGIWTRETVPRVPPRPTEAEFARLPPSNGPGPGVGHVGLDFTWNDTVVHVWVDPMTSGSIAALPATVQDGVLQGMEHVSGPLAALPGARAKRGPLLGVNATLEVCSPQGAWVLQEAGEEGAPRPPPHPDNITLFGVYGGLLHIPLAPLWGMLASCQTEDCTYSMRRGPPAALLERLHGVGPSAGAREALAREILKAAAAAAGLPATPFPDAALHVDASCAVVVGVAAGAAAAPTLPSAAGRAAARRAGATLPTPPHRELLFSAAARAGARVAGYLFPPLLPSSSSPSSLPREPPCTPGSLRLTAVEWSFPAEPFHLLTRLALSGDAWLRAYSRDVDESLGGWERYLRDLTRSGAAALHSEGCMVQHSDPSAAVCEGRVRGPASTPRVRSEASWVLLDGFTHKRAVSAGESAAAQLGPGVGFTGLLPALPGGANVSFFKLLHWWPGYDLDSGIRDVRGWGRPPLVSFVISPNPLGGLLRGAFGESWVIACYMIFAGGVISIHALATCYAEQRYKNKMKERGAAKAAARGGKRDRQGSANSTASSGSGGAGGGSGGGAALDEAAAAVVAALAAAAGAAAKGGGEGAAAALPLPHPTAAATHHLNSVPAEPSAHHDFLRGHSGHGGHVGADVSGSGAHRSASGDTEAAPPAAAAAAAAANAHGSATVGGKKKGSARG
jgi:hypothetical protein